MPDPHWMCIKLGLFVNETNYLSQKHVQVLLLNNLGKSLLLLPLSHLSSFLTSLFKGEIIGMGQISLKYLQNDDRDFGYVNLLDSSENIVGVLCGSYCLEMKEVLDFFFSLPSFHLFFLTDPNTPKFLTQTP